MIGYKFRIYPNEEQKHFFAKQFGCCRFVYNQCLAKSQENYKNDKTSRPIFNYAWLKDEFPWLAEADSLGLAYAGQNLKVAYTNFFRTKKGFPKFHRKNGKQSYKTTCRVVGGRLKVPKLKSTIRIVIHRELPCEPKNVVISQDKSGKYFASLLFDYDKPLLPKVGKSIGIDLGIKELCICSDGTRIANPKTLLKHERKLKTLHRSVSRKQKGSNRRKQACQKLAREYERVRNIHNDFLHKTSWHIVSENQVICLEDLNVVSMMKNHSLAKAVSDAQFGKLVDMISYKAEMYGREVRFVDRFFASSQICNNCGYQNKNTKDLSVREWMCPQCGARHDRDLNAALNILAEACSVSGRGVMSSGSYCEATSPLVHEGVL